MITADNAAAITDIGFPIARRYEDDTIDDVGLARTLAAASARTDMTSAPRNLSPRRYRAR